MNDIEELPSWAGRALKTGSVAPIAELPPDRGQRRKILAWLFGLLLLGGLAGGGFWFINSSSDDEVATDAATATTAAAATTDDSAADDNSTDDATTDDTTEDSATAADEPAAPTTAVTAADTGADAATDAATDASADEGADGLLSLPDGYVPSDPNFDERVAANTRYVVISKGQVYLYGYVPTEELREQIAAVAGGVVGPDNVITETIVDPDAPVPPDAPVFIDDKVLFGFNSVAIEPAFLPILDLGVLLMSQNAAAEITIVSRTDAAGSESINMDVSRQRAQTVVNYWAAKGIDRGRIVVDPRGETDASADDDVETAALNRSVEFRIAKLFGE